MWTSGIENAFTAEMSQFLGIPNPALKQQFLTSVLHSEELAAGMQVVLLLTHRENHFDWKALITAAVQPVVNLEIQTYVPPIADSIPVANYYCIRSFLNFQHAMTFLLLFE